jgi:hypothetical protein
VHDRTFLFGPGLRRHRQRNHPRRPDVEVGTRPPRRLALLGLIAGPLILIRATLVLFDVVDPGDPTDVLAVPEFIWEAAPGLLPTDQGLPVGTHAGRCELTAQNGRPDPHGGAGGGQPAPLCEHLFCMDHRIRCSVSSEASSRGGTNRPRAKRAPTRQQRESGSRS